MVWKLTKPSYLESGKSMKKLVRSIYKWLHVMDVETWGERDWVWFYTLVVAIILATVGIASLSYHVDELLVQNANLQKIVAHGGLCK